MSARTRYFRYPAILEYMFFLIFAKCIIYDYLIVIENILIQVQLKRLALNPIAAIPLHNAMCGAKSKCILTLSKTCPFWFPTMVRMSAPRNSPRFVTSLASWVGTWKWENRLFLASFMRGCIWKKRVDHFDIWTLVDDEINEQLR